MREVIVLHPTAFQLLPFAILQLHPLSEMHGKGKQKTAMAKNGLHGWRVWLHEGDRMHVAGCRTCRHCLNQ